MVKIIKCPPGEAIGYRDNDPRLNLTTRTYLETRKIDLLYQEDIKKELAMNIHKDEHDDV